MSAYSASKAAIIGLTKSAAKDLAACWHPCELGVACLHRTGTHVGQPSRLPGGGSEPLLRRRSCGRRPPDDRDGRWAGMAPPTRSPGSSRSSCPTIPRTSPASTSRSPVAPPSTGHGGRAPTTPVWDRDHRWSRSLPRRASARGPAHVARDVAEVSGLLSANHEVWVPDAAGRRGPARSGALWLLLPRAARGPRLRSGTQAASATAAAVRVQG